MNQLIFIGLYDMKWWSDILFIRLFILSILQENKAFLERPITDRNASFGSQKFVELEVLDTRDYIRENIMFIKVVVDSEGTD